MQEKWSGVACERTDFFADRSEPTLEEANITAISARVLPPSTSVSAKAERLHTYLLEVRQRMAELQDELAKEADNEAAKEESENMNVTLFSMGGVRRLAQDMEDVRRAELAEMKKRLAELEGDALERERSQVLEDAVRDALRRSIVQAQGKGPNHMLGEFKLFHSEAPRADLDDGVAKDVVKDVEIGKVFEHQVESHHPQGDGTKLVHEMGPYLLNHA